MTSIPVACAVSGLCAVTCFMAAMITDKAIVPMMLYWIGVTLGLFSGISLERTFREERRNY